VLPPGKVHRRGERRVAPGRRPPPALARTDALFLDIDGTLLHHADAPDQVHVGAGLLALLPAVSRRLGGAVALITGRSIRDADRLFPGLKLAIAGQHGCSRRSVDGAIHRHPGPLPGLSNIRRDLNLFAQRHPGILLEDKGSTFAVHYRRVPNLAALVHRKLRTLLAGMPEGAWVIQRGKAVAELRPHGRDKGTAILEYLEESPFRGRVPVFVGDDLTDEYGFAAVASQGGWAVKVGRGPTVARYRLSNVVAVRSWLATTAHATNSETIPTPSTERS
jgi:trehalose 6-phosphate phosphatase